MTKPALAKNRTKPASSSPGVKKELKVNPKLAARKIPLVWFLLSVALLLGFATWTISWKFREQNGTSSGSLPGKPPHPVIKQFSDNDFRLIRPVVFMETADESPEFDPLKGRLSLLISEKKRSGILASAGIYLRRLSDGNWMSLGADGAFQAGSLLKVPIMICWLKMSGSQPGLLGKKLFFPKPAGTIPGQTFGGSSIVPERFYTVAELLEFMIVESDNNATYVLGQNMDMKLFQKIFTDLGLARPQITSMGYSLTSSQYSRFLFVLYHSTMLDPSLSEFALDLMTRCNFNIGMTRSLPKEIVTAHKFGEQGDFQGLSELSESGIVYSRGGPYLLTVMTKGENIRQLSDIISMISNEVYESMQP